MATTKRTAAKPAPKGKTTVKVPEPEAPRENRYSRSAKVIASNLTIDVQALSEQAEMSTSTARHCLEAWNGITQVLLQRGAITPTWAKQLKPRAEKVETTLAPNADAPAK
jgi:hypothetical protein